MGLSEEKTNSIELSRCLIKVRGLDLTLLTLYFEAGMLTTETLDGLELTIRLVDEASKREIFYLAEVDNVSLSRYDNIEESIAISGLELEGPYINTGGVALSNIDLFKPTFRAYLKANKDIEVSAELEFDLNSMKYSVQCYTETNSNN